jgi:uncharacterized membrane protein YbhN (UPF0104 family)
MESSSMFRVIRGQIFVAIKLVLTLAVFAYVFRHLDLSHFAIQIRAVPAWLLISIVAWVIVQMAFFAPSRIHLVLGALGFKIPLKILMKISWSAFFFEQAGLNFVGGDIARVLLLNRVGIPKVFAAEGLIIDRITGVGSLILLSLIGLPTLLRTLPAEISNLASIWIVVFGIMAAAGLALIAFGIGLHRIRHWRTVRFMRDSLRRLSALRVRKWVLPTTTAVALFTHLSNVTVFYFMGIALDLPLSWGEWLMLVPAALFLSMLPISVAGWGIREGAFIFALGSHGIPPSTAIVPSVLYGLSVLAASLPGGVVWILMRSSPSFAATASFASRSDPLIDPVVKAEPHH